MYQDTYGILSIINIVCHDTPITFPCFKHARLVSLSMLKGFRVDTDCLLDSNLKHIKSELVQNKIKRKKRKRKYFDLKLINMSLYILSTTERTFAGLFITWTRHSETEVFHFVTAVILIMTMVRLASERRDHNWKHVSFEFTETEKPKDWQAAFYSPLFLNRHSQSFLEIWGIERIKIKIKINYFKWTKILISWLNLQTYKVIYEETNICSDTNVILNNFLLRKCEFRHMLQLCRFLGLLGLMFWKNWYQFFFCHRLFPRYTKQWNWPLVTI